MTRILVVDDEPAIRDAVSYALQQEGFDVEARVDGESGLEGCRLGSAIGTYLHGPLLPRNPWLADWLLGRALAHAGAGEAPTLPPLPDELEEQAFRVSAERARRRGGRR